MIVTARLDLPLGWRLGEAVTEVGRAIVPVVDEVGNRIGQVKQMVLVSGESAQIEIEITDLVTQETLRDASYEMLSYDE